MNDRELLELAAKAVGIQLRFLSDSTPFSDGPRVGEWNPLTDDGDALRLAVQLGMNIHYPTMIGSSKVHVSSIKRVEEKLFEDPYAATRRAIVRAAAEIGKDM